MTSDLLDVAAARHPHLLHLQRARQNGDAALLHSTEPREVAGGASE